MNQASRRLAQTGVQQNYSVAIGPTVRKPGTSGFSLLELMIVVSLVGLLALIAIPNFLQSRLAAQRGACISNLHEIDNATQTWAMETQKAVDSPVTYADITSYLKGTVLCPAGGPTFSRSYALGTVSDAPTCLVVPDTHFLGEDAARPSHKKPKPHPH